MQPVPLRLPTLQLRTLCGCLCWLLGAGLGWSLSKPTALAGLPAATALFPHGLAALTSAGFASHFLRTLRGVVLTNVLVALSISLGGLLTGGVLTLLTFVWNGFLISLVVQQYVLGAHLAPLATLVIFAHAPLELLAFIGLGNIGLLGLPFYQGLWHGRTAAQWQQLRQACSRPQPAWLLGALLAAALIESFVLTWHLL